ncbi:MAG TPA: hypothetical protein VF316_02380, partial [Polyangiaceae bacterium]
MDLQERLSYLENVRDWQALVDELEKGIAGASQNAQKAAYHLQLGRVLETKFLSGVKALKHFQDAYKMNPALLESLEAARMIYWDLGKLNMVQKLLDLELKAVQGAEASVLLLELGDVLCDLGDYDKATATYARSLAASGGANKDASASLEDVQAESGSWQELVGQLLRAAHEVGDGPVRSRMFLRAARIARRFAPDDMGEMLAKAYAADPTSKPTAALYEGAMTDQGQGEILEATQTELLMGLADRKARAKLALLFGIRWVGRHQNAEVGTRFLEEALKLDPSMEGAFNFLRDAYGKKGGDWNRVMTLAEEAVAQSSENGEATFLLAQTATIAWRELGDLMRARSVFERLSSYMPEHPQLRAFEAQIGEAVGSKDGKPAAFVPEAAVAPSGVPTPRTLAATAPVVHERPTAPPPQTASADVEIEVAVSVESVAPPAPEPTPMPAI